MKLTTPTSLALAALALPAAAAAQVTNIAPGGTASQSSNWVPETPASDAIDGNTNTDYFAGSMQHTDNDLDAWWRVDFDSSQEMFEIRLHNRSDCGFCAARLSNFRVSVFEGGVEVFGEDAYVGAGSVPGGGVHTVVLPAGTSGDAVQVQFLGFNNSGNGYLHMSEVEIDGRALGSIHCVSNPNSTGRIGDTVATGSLEVSRNSFHLLAVKVPASQFGFFVASPTPASMPAPNSVGVLCLGGPYARFNGQVLQTPDFGVAVGTRIDLSAIPLSPVVPVLPGQTWYFQYWHRDVVGVSNFTSGLMATFQ